MLESYRTSSENEWCWFENNVTYDNGILPLALFHYYEIIHDEEVLQVAIASTDWLDSWFFKTVTSPWWAIRVVYQRRKYADV